MQPFHRLTGVAAPLPIANVDTDMILPAAFLKTVSRQGLGRGLFHNLRKDGQDFVLDRAPWTQAQILVTLDNFGCGSSREHAPWALLDFGISCIVAPSFADIFNNNCFKNGILPIPLPRDAVETLMADAAAPETATLTVDLVSQTIQRRNGEMGFEIDPVRRARLLSGLDDIANALRFEDAIAGYEARVRAEVPWLAEMGIGPEPA
jgi:3-isopropylmalate/(R)-2-methylmalate dehydratase small subunit